MSLTPFVTTATIKEKQKKEGRMIKKKSTALTGNRTRAPRVAGEDSTTEPSVHS